MSNLILPGSKEYNSFRKSAEGQKILGRYTLSERILDAAEYIAAPVEIAAKAAAATGLAIILASCSGDAGQAPEAPKDDSKQAATAPAGASPAERYSEASGKAPEAPADIKDMDEQRKAEAERKGAYLPPADKVVPLDRSAEEKKKETLNAMALLAKKAEEAAAESAGTAAPKVIKVPEEPAAHASSEKAQIPNAAEDLKKLMETPSGKGIERVVRQRGTRVLPRLSEVISRGKWDPSYPFYNLDDTQDYHISASLRGEVGEVQNSFAERLTAGVRPFNGLITDAKVLDSVLFNMFLENINSATQREFYEDLGSRTTRARIGAGFRISDLLDSKDITLILGIDYTYEDTEFSDIGDHPKQKYIGLAGINAFLKVPAEDLSAYVSFRGSDAGRWVSFPGRYTGNTHYFDYRKMQFHADINKRFKRGWHAGAEFDWQREDFEGVNEDTTRWSALLKGGQNNFLSQFGVKNDILRGIDLMLIYGHTQRHHERKGTTDYDRVGIIGAIPLLTDKDGRETVILRPEFGYELNGRGAYTALELMLRLGK